MLALRLYVTCYIYQQRMMLNRTMTMDTASIQERLNRRRMSSSSSAGEGGESLENITELSDSSSSKAKQAEPATAATEESVEDMKKLREELGEVKNKLVDLTQVSKGHFVLWKCP